MADQSLSKERLRQLQDILETENARPYDIAEVERIGRGLISLYSNLADNDLGIGIVTQTGYLESDKIKGLENEPTNVSRVHHTIKGFARISRHRGLLTPSSAEAA